MAIKFTGDAIRPGVEFRFVTQPENMAGATFLAPDGDLIRVTRRASDLFELGDETPVIAHWHGERRTDAFLLTIGELKAKADAYLSELRSRG